MERRVDCAYQESCSGWWGPTKAEVNVGSHDYHAAESCSMFTHKSVPLKRGEETLQLSFEPEEVNQPNESKG